MSSFTNFYVDFIKTLFWLHSFQCVTFLCFYFEKMQHFILQSQFFFVHQQQTCSHKKEVLCFEISKKNHCNFYVSLVGELHLKHIWRFQVWKVWGSETDLKNGCTFRVKTISWNKKIFKHIIDCMQLNFTNGFTNIVL